MSRRGFHIPALASLLGTLGGLATAIVAVPALTHTTVGKVAAGVVGTCAVIQSVTKPINRAAH